MGHLDRGQISKLQGTRLCRLSVTLRAVRPQGPRGRDGQGRGGGFPIVTCVDAAGFGVESGRYCELLAVALASWLGRPQAFVRRA